MKCYAQKRKYRVRKTPLSLFDAIEQNEKGKVGISAWKIA